MLNYINKSLCTGERVIKKARVSVFSEWGPFVMGALFFFAYKPLGILIILPGIIRILTTELAITNYRVIAKSGLIKRNTVELNLDRVESLRVNQGVMGRLLNYGSISVIGTGGTEAPIPSIDSPMEFRKSVNNYLAEMREKRYQNATSSTQSLIESNAIQRDSASTEIMRLVELRDNGILTEEEFQNAKGKVLNK